MAIRLITGKPGTGKTYYAVKHLKDNYYKKNSRTRLHELKENVTVYSNIKNLKLPHENLTEAISEHGLETFFSSSFQEKLSETHGSVVFFIDECQQYFHKKYYNQEVFYYFQTHRHLGQDVFLITQDAKLLPGQIVALAENETYAQARSISFFGELKYIVKIGYENVDRKVLKKSKEIFNLYKSSNGTELETIRNPFIKYLFFLIILFVVAVYLFYGYFLKPTQAKTIPEEKIGSAVPIQQIVPRETIEIEEVEPTKVVRLSYVIIKKRLWVIDPVTNAIIPVNKIPYTVSIEKIGTSLLVTAKIPLGLLPSNPENKPDRRRQ